MSRRKENRIEGWQREMHSSSENVSTRPNSYTCIPILTHKTSCTTASMFSARVRLCTWLGLPDKRMQWPKASSGLSHATLGYPSMAHGPGMSFRIMPPISAYITAISYHIIGKQYFLAAEGGEGDTESCRELNNLPGGPASM